MQMNPTVIIVFVVAFAAILVVLLKVFSSSADNRKRSLMKRAAGDGVLADEDALIDDSDEKNFRDTPIIGELSVRLKQAGIESGVLVFLVLSLVVYVISVVVISTMFASYVFGLVLGLIFTVVMLKAFINYKIEKRNQIFLDNFPDALDMIVRSVKSGHPLLSSLRMIAESSEEHIAREFQQVVDEVSYGSPLSESLHRMADRINLLDINFFVVILSVQQDTGGNLSEVLGNLSTIIRKRRQLRLKINAMTAEGRFTSWIFAAIPIVQLLAVKLMVPEYVNILFTTGGGRMILGTAAGLIIFSVYMSKKMCKIDI